MSSTGVRVSSLIRLSPAETLKVEKFIRCNGAAGVESAARETAAITARDGPRVDPWAYCIGVHNGNLARAATLFPLLHLLENSLRARIDFYLSQSLAGAAWYRSPSGYLSPSSAGNLVRYESCSGVQDRTASAQGPWPIKPFPSGTEFLEHVPFWVIVDIVNHNLRGPLRWLFTADNTRPPVAPTRVATILLNVHDCRNEIAHHRGVRLSLYTTTALGLNELLEALEFDVARAGRRVMDLVEVWLKAFPNPA